MCVRAYRIARISAIYSAPAINAHLTITINDDIHVQCSVNYFVDATLHFV